MGLKTLEKNSGKQGFGNEVKFSDLVYFQAMKPSAPLALYSRSHEVPTDVLTVQSITEKKQY